MNSRSFASAILTSIHWAWLGGSRLELRQSAQPAPRLRVLTEQGVEIKRNVTGGILPGQGRGGGRNLFGIGRDALQLDQSLLVRDSQSIQKRTHHRSMASQMIDNQRPGGQAIGKVRQAGEMACLVLLIEADDRLGPELLLLRDEQDRLRLILGGLLGAPERQRDVLALTERQTPPEA